MAVGELVFAGIVQGAILGATLILLSIGLTLIFSLMGVINFAHGAFYMMGAYFVAYFSEWIGFLPSLVVAGLIVGIVGVISEYLIVRPIYDEDHVMQVLVTFGLTLVLTEVMKLLAIRVTGDSSMVMNVPGYLQGSFQIGPATVTVYDAFVVVFSLAVVGLIGLGLGRTNVGSIVRGGTRDSEIIEVMGINIQWYWTGMFGFGCMLAGLAGGISAPTNPILPTMGNEILLLVFVVVIVGGIGSFRGSIVAGMLVGLLMGVTGVFWSGGTFIVVFVALIAVLLVRPEGLMGKEEMME